MWGLPACLALTANTNPFINFRKLEAEKSSYPMSRQTFILYPPVNGIFVDAKVRRNSRYTYPAFIYGHINPSLSIMGNM